MYDVVTLFTMYNSNECYLFSSIIKDTRYNQRIFFLFDVYDIVTLFAMFNWNEWYLFFQ